MSDRIPVRTWIVTEAEAGQKLLAYLQRRLGRDLPQAALMRWIRTGQVRVDGGRKGPYARLQAGARVRVPPFAPPERQDRAPRSSLPPLRVVHQGRGLLVVAKPAGLPTQPGSGWSDSAQARLVAMRPGADFAPTPAHRLDKDTSGLLLAAESYARLAELHGLFRQGAVRKAYLAWVAGAWKHGGPTLLEDRLEKQGGPGREKVRSGSGKIALAEARLLRRNSGASLLELRLLTGRTHQLRVQLASRGHAIVGDRKYGGPACEAGMLLHAWKLELPDGSFVLDPDWPEPWTAP